MAFQFDGKLAISLTVGNWQRKRLFTQSRQASALSKDLKPLYGHTPLSNRELGFLADEKPDVIYVGLGYDGALPVTDEAKKILSQHKSVMSKTPEVIEKLADEERSYVAIIHVTC